MLKRLLNQKRRIGALFLAILLVISGIPGINMGAFPLDFEAGEDQDSVFEMGTPGCGMTEHRHTQDCYTTRQVKSMDCPYSDSKDVVLHIHDQNCYLDGKLVCELEETPLGEGEAIFLDEEGTLFGTDLSTFGEPVQRPLSEKAELVAREGIYNAYQEEGIDGLLVYEGDLLLPHVHGSECYNKKGKLICDKAQCLWHQHDASCFRESTQRVLTCGLQEHIHTEECFEAQEGQIATFGSDEAGQIAEIGEAAEGAQEAEGAEPGKNVWDTSDDMESILEVFEDEESTELVGESDEEFGTPVVEIFEEEPAIEYVQDFSSEFLNESSNGDKDKELDKGKEKDKEKEKGKNKDKNKDKDENHQELQEDDELDIYGSDNELVMEYLPLDQAQDPFLASRVSGGDLLFQPSQDIQGDIEG